MTFPTGVDLRGVLNDRYATVLTAEALHFAASLERQFGKRRRELLSQRAARQIRLDHGERPDFLAGTRQVREVAWKVAPLPDDLQDRRVEITGPPERKTVINALNSGAKVFMADFEDSLTPTWANLIEGQINLRDAVRKTIAFEDATTGKRYFLAEKPAVLFVRVRGWHLEEAHLHVDGEPMSGGIFDFSLYAFHNARELLSRGSGPYFYLPKMESHLEARLWNEIFVASEKELGLRAGAVKATVLIETLPAAFEMDEILYELRDRSAGLNCGRWDYIFSYIKKLAGDKSLLLPDRSQVTMTTHFLRSYSKLAIQTCHRRGVHAMGGMSALIPVKDDPGANEEALTQVRADKEREAMDGHDGTWVAHPGLVATAVEVFDRLMPGPNQIDKQLKIFRATAEDLLRAPEGTITEAGLKQNVIVGLRYIEAWLRGIGCVPLFHLMEDAATAEISRAQLWQWVHHGATLYDGRPVTLALCDDSINAELQRATTDGMEMRSFEHAAFLLRELIRAPRFADFLTQPAYARVVAAELAATPLAAKE